MSISSSVSTLASNIFSKLDTKNQGYIDKTDLKSAFEKIDSSTSDIDAIFSKMDGDQDGKITESELTTSINSLVDQLNSQMNSARTSQGMQTPPPGGMPPPPPQSQEDESFTQEELTKIAASTDDTKLSSLMSTIAANFEAADTNEDGEVSSQEAIAYQQTKEAESTQTTDGTSTGSTEDQQVSSTMMKLAQLIKAYGLSGTAESSSISTAA